MWKKDEAQPTTPSSGNAPSPTSRPLDFDERPRTAAPAPARNGGRALVGSSIAVQGEVSGSEDLLIEGRVEGSVELDGQLLTIGSGGFLKGRAKARTIIVEGEVEGDLNGEEDVVLRASGRMQGDIRAPRVALDAGCRFRGSIDMGATESTAERTPKKVAAEKPAADRAAPDRAAPDKSATEKSEKGAGEILERLSSAPAS